MKRTIIHLDLDAFFCSVEEKLDPGLRGKAFAVGGKPGQRGVISSCSYTARQRGIHSAMPASRAVRLCPELIILPGRHHLYSEDSRQVMKILSETSPLVEQVSIDEAFLDVSMLPEEGIAVGCKLQDRIQRELDLPCSLGIASNKLVAKIATDYGKKNVKGGKAPRAITVVPPGEEASFLSPLPSEMLWGVGPKTSARLAEVGLHTIGQVANWPEADLVARFGENGRDLARRAKGIDESPILTEHEIKSISQEVTFARDEKMDDVLERTLRDLSSQVGRRLRKSGMAGTTVKLKLRWPDFTTLTRQLTCLQATDQDDEIYESALALLRKVRDPGHPVRLIGVGVSGLGPPLRQLGLWDADSQKHRRLQEAIDDLQERYGEHAIQRGERKLKRKERVSHHGSQN